MEKHQILDKYFKGKLSNVEAEEIMTWCLSKNGEQVLGDEIEADFRDSSPRVAHKDWEGEKVWCRIKHEIEQDTTSFPVEEKKVATVRFVSKYKLLKIAAVVTLAIASIFTLYQYQFEGTKDFISESTGRGERRQIDLPDGSLVHLNAMSTISYSNNFESDRSVHLVGEAFFEVKKDPAHPFSVLNGQLTTTALGTSFNVRGYNTDNEVEVILITGKVSVEDHRSKQIISLVPGEIATLNESNKLIKSNADTMKTGWKDNILYFSETPLTEVITTLNRWYDSSIEVRNMKKNVYCSGTFQNESLDQVLAVLSYSIGFDFKIDDDNITLTFP